MDIQYLRTFQTVTKADSFAQAAEKLGYTRSTVTFHIHQLEREFGLKLFEKIGRQMHLTEKGRDILPFINNILDNYDQIAAVSNRPQEKVRIAVAESFLAYQFQTILRETRRILPGVVLDIQVTPCSEMYDAVLSGRVDMALHYDILGAHPQIHTQRIQSYPLVLFGSADPAAEHPRRWNETGEITDFVDLDESGFYRHCLDRVLQEHAAPTPGKLIMGSVSSLIQCVKADLGLAVLPYFAVENELAAGAIQTLNAKLEPDTIPIAISYHHSKWLSPALTTLLDIIRQSL